MEIVEVQRLHIQGVSVRTRNADEADPERACIGALWADFAVQVAPHTAQGAVTYGVYHHYESDANGAYDLLAGSDALEKNEQTAAQPWQGVTICAGSYGVFQVSGAMPQAVMAAWGRVWAYFADPHCPYQRAYTTDFERYGPDGVVEIFIALAAS